MAYFTSRVLFAIASLILALAAFASAHNRPVIGIFAQPKRSMGENRTYIAASYVKWVESAGGRVIPIPYDIPADRAEVLMSQINGVLFPGGASYINDSAKKVFEIAVRKNEEGVHFPIWATCMGFQWMSMYFSGDDQILDNFNSYNVTYPLIFTEEATNSRFYRKAPAGLIDIYSNPDLKVTLNNHNYGVNLPSFEKKLKQHFRLVSINKDEDGKEFVDTIEHWKYPMYGVQWHPEKNMFEWDMKDDGTPYEVIQHTAEAILAAQYPANFFVNEARVNNQKFADPVFEKAKLIYNYNSTVSSYGFIQTYYFDDLEF